MRYLGIVALTFFALSFVHGQKPDGNAVSFSMNYMITSGTNTKSVLFEVVVPQSQTHRQKITKITYNPQPAKTFEKDGNAYAQFVINSPKTTTNISIAVEGEIYRHDLASVSSASRRRMDDAKNLKKYTVAEKFLEVKAPEIVKLAETLKGNSDEDTVRKTMSYLLKNMKKGDFDSEDHGALWMLEKKKGDCTEFTDLFVTLCRANGIPARFCEGYLIQDIQKGDTAKHDWAEVYLGELGWVPFDPLHVNLGAATTDRLKPIYVYLDNQRQNPMLNNYHFFRYSYVGDAIKLTEDFKIISKKNLLFK